MGVELNRYLLMASGVRQKTGVRFARVVAKGNIIFLTIATVSQQKRYMNNKSILGE